MNPGGQSNTRGGAQPSTGLGLEDVYYTLFRHKWLILAFICLGLVGAAVIPIVRPPSYVSWAKLMVLYRVERGTTLMAGPDAIIKSADSGSAGIISSEIEILKSADVASNAAAAVGAEKILAKRGGGNDLMSAAGVVYSGIEVENPRGTEMLTVSFKHRDKTVVQPVLNALIDTYMHKHWEVWRGGSEMNKFYNEQSEELRTKLAQTEEELRKIKEEAKVMSVEETKKAYQSSLLKWQEELLTARGELAERMAMLDNPPAGTPGAGTTKTNENSVPFEKLKDYSELISDLDTARKQEHELLIHYREAHPLVLTVEARIEKLKQDKSELEQAFPSLARLGAGISHSGTNSPGMAMADDLGEIRKHTARVTYIESVISNIQVQASQVLAIEPKINEVTRKRDLLETNYQSLAALVQQSLAGKDQGAGQPNMSIVQRPTPPSIDSKKLKKTVSGVLGACAACGVALAFLIDFVFVRTIRRSADIERHLRLPVLLTIPDTTWRSGLQLERFTRWWHGKAGNGTPATDGGEGEPATTSLAPWKAGYHLQTYAEGLRERLMTYFEVHNLNLKKPKLVAVTACGQGSGVSTLAGGLAAALSKTGDGNVLLVDMNAGQGVTHAFYKGEPGCGLSDALSPGSHLDAQVEENLYLAKMDEGNAEKTSKMLPTRFNHLMPKLKGSDYDYIIFDMPPVTQTSATPRLASYMDITLLVLESEKTGQEMASRASALMRESRANVAAVLNKYRPRVPGRLSQEL